MKRSLTIRLVAAVLACGLALPALGGDEWYRGDRTGEEIVEEPPKPEDYPNDSEFTYALSQYHKQRARQQCGGLLQSIARWFNGS